MSLNDFLLLLFLEVCTLYVAVVILRRGGFKRGRGERVPSLFFTITCFCNHSAEAETVLCKVELIINNAPLTYIYPNTIQTCLTLSHL